MQSADIPGFDQMTASEKILLVEDLWDHIPPEVANTPVPESHKQELDQRRARHTSAPGRVLTLDELQARIEARK